MITMVSILKIESFFGNSISVWSSTIGVICLSIILGLVYGTVRVSKNKYLIDMKRLVIIASFFVLIFPIISPSAISLFIDVPLGVGAALSLATILAPILFCLSSTIPLMVNILGMHQTVNEGTISAFLLSSILSGALVFSYLTVFILLPKLGISMSVFLALAMLFLVYVLLIVDYNIRNLGPVALLGFCFVFFGFILEKENRDNKIIYESDGLLGNIKVVDQSAEIFGQSEEVGRALFVDNSLQNFIDHSGNSMWHWSHLLPTIIGTKPQGSKTLLFGLGAGSLYNQIKSLNHDIDVVEKDQRIWNLAKEYFNFPMDEDVIIADARQYLNTCKERYDVICFDLFEGDSPPNNLYTREGIQQAATSLKPDGIIVINYFGFLEGDKGYAARSIIKTIVDLGLKINVIPTVGSEDSRNLMLVISNDIYVNYNQSFFYDPAKKPFKAWAKLLHPIESIDLNSATIITDENASMKLFSSLPSEAWRKAYNEIFATDFLK